MPRSDFDGDGRSDVLWRNIDNGYTSNWLGTESGAFFVNDANALDPWAIGNLAAVGDFNGDGRADTLWRYDQTELFLSFTAPGGSFQFFWSLGFAPPEVPISWTVAGAGDFDGDGLDDILWTSNDGRMSNWLSDGDYTFVINDAIAMTTLGSSTVQAIGNFDGTGGDDVLIRHADGGIDVLFSNEDGGFETDYSDPIVVSSDWHIVGTGDFDGDGDDDILWRHNNGTVSNWLSSGDAAFAEFVVNDANALVNVPVDWLIVGIGDYNGDGRDDILWRNLVNGAVSDWLGTEEGGWIINDAAALTTAPLEWYVAPQLGGQGWDY